MNTPSAPDPYATAAAQTTSNENTAQYQQSLNQTNQITPYGSVNYAQTGTGADGAPITTATTSLSQPVQNLVNSNLANSQGESDLAGTLQGNVGNSISSGTPSAPSLQNLNGLQNLNSLQNLQLGPSQIQANLDAANRATLDPQWAAAGQQNDQTTYDRGLAPGSDGYTQAQNTFNNAKNSAYNSMYVADQGQATADLTAQNASANQNATLQNASANSNLTAQNASANQNAQAGFQNNLTAYNAPLNALSALQSGSQISQPGVGQTAATPQTSVAGTNLAGLVQSNYQNQLAQSNATMGGLFGLGGTALQLGSSFL